ncbi:MAG: DUF2515 family protein [Myxococcales bacterium]|nr:DUF2515 family protein [Myxococcales bacterium]
MDVLRLWLDELEQRNRDNVARTAAYLELYRYTVENPPDLPWVLMAHLVSRNAGYLMSDVAARLAGSASGERAAMPGYDDALRELFLMLERANYLIFHDAWYHVAQRLVAGAAGLDAARTTRFIVTCWRRYEAAAGSAREVDPALERQLVLELVENEQNLIERRVVHNPRFAAAMRLVALIEASGREKPIELPLCDTPITVGGFARLEQRIAAGARIYDALLADRARRAEIVAWCVAHPHSGSRAAHGGKASPEVQVAWPRDEVLALLSSIYDPPEPDPLWP